MQERLLIPEKARRGEGHHVWGKFLGYPPRCTEEYVRPRTREELAARRRKGYSYRFAVELGALITKEGRYSDIFDYCPPAFTPCSVNCPNATTVLTQWKDVVEKYDAGASQGILLLNRQGNPQCLAHQDFVNEHRKTQNLEKLRLWLSGTEPLVYRYQKR